MARNNLWRYYVQVHVWLFAQNILPHHNLRRAYLASKTVVHLMPRTTVHLAAQTPWLAMSLSKLEVHVRAMTFGPLAFTSRPPKGDRSEGFYIKTSIFLDFPQLVFFKLKIILFYMEIEPE